MKIKQVKITNTRTQEVKIKEITEDQYQRLKDDKFKRNSPIEIEVLKTREI